MTPMNRSRMSRCFGVLIGAAALITALPAPALAEHREERRHHEERGRRGHDRDHELGRGHAYGWGHAPRRHHGHYAYRAPRYSAPPRWGRGGHEHHAPAYYCGRCRSHFGSYQGLYGHVQHHHRVPTWRVPRVLAQVSFGWAFGL